MKRSWALPILLLSACGQPEDRLSDEQALADAPDVPVNEPAENFDEPIAAPAAISTEELYRAVGNEPGWGLLVRADGMLYQGRYGTVRITEATPPDFKAAPGTYRSGRIAITIAQGPCSDGMSDKSYRDKVQVIAAGETVRGCGGGEVQVDANRLEGTRWTVTEINGRPTGGGRNFGLSFSNGVVTGKFGCNSLQGSFSSNGDHLFVEDLVATEMACSIPIVELEREGLTVLNSNLRMERIEGRLRLVSEAGEIDLVPAG